MISQITEVRMNVALSDPEIKLIKFQTMQICVSKTVGNLGNEGGNGNENATKQWVLMSKNNRSARVFTFWYISFPSSTKQQREMTKFHVFQRTWTHDGKFVFLFPYFDAVHCNLVPG